jgi:hypothetical protein
LTAFAGQIDARMNASAGAFEIPAERDVLRARVLELRAHLNLGDQLGRQLLAGYGKHAP